MGDYSELPGGPHLQSYSTREQLMSENAQLRVEVEKLKKEVQRLQSKLADIDEDLRQRVPRSMRSEFY